MDQASSVQITFRSNPRSNIDQWVFDSENNHSDFTLSVDRKDKGPYMANLTFTMQKYFDGKNFTLEVSNVLGNTTITFTLNLEVKTISVETTTTEATTVEATTIEVSTTKA